MRLQQVDLDTFFLLAEQQGTVFLQKDTLVYELSLGQPICPSLPSTIRLHLAHQGAIEDITYHYYFSKNGLELTTSTENRQTSFALVGIGLGESDATPSCFYAENPELLEQLEVIAIGKVDTTYQALVVVPTACQLRQNGAIWEMERDTLVTKTYPYRQTFLSLVEQLPTAKKKEENQ